MAMRRRLLQLQPLLAQQVLRGATPKPRLQPTPHRRFLYSPSPPAAVFPSALPNLAPADECWGRRCGRPNRRRAVAICAWRWVARAILSAPKEVLGPAPFSTDILRRRALISLDNLMSGRLHTLLTNAFSHKDSSHLFNNMIGLYFFGSSIARMFGTTFLLKLYVAGAVTGSAFFLAEKALLAPRNEGFGGWKTPALGASAAVNATILLDIFLYPKKTLYYNFFIPIPAALVGAGFIGADLWRIMKGQSDVSGSAHLGGALVAALLWARLRKGWI